MGFEQNNKTLPEANGPRILSPKLELSLKAETNANSNLTLLTILMILMMIMSDDNDGDDNDGDDGYEQWQ